MHMSRRNNTETAFKFVLKRKKCNMLNDKRIKACISRYDNAAYSRMQFLAAVSHSIPWVLTQRHCDLLKSEDCSRSSSDEDEKYEASPATLH